MLKSAFFTFIYFLSIVLFSQETEILNITYSQRIHWNVDDSTKYSRDQITALKKAMNEKVYYTLLTSQSESIYKNKPKINNDLASGDNQIKFSSSESFIYINFIDSIIFTEDTYPKHFFIKENLPNYKWKLMDNIKEYKNHKIKLAQTIYNGYQIDAWYAEEIKFKSGPKFFWGLPGLILIVEIKHIKSGEITQILAEEISNDQSITNLKPKIKESKIITREKFNEILNLHIQKENEIYGLGVDKD